MERERYLFSSPLYEIARKIVSSKGREIRVRGDFSKL